MPLSPPVLALSWRSLHVVVLAVVGAMMALATALPFCDLVYQDAREGQRSARLHLRSLAPMALVVMGAIFPRFPTPVGPAPHCRLVTTALLWVVVTTSVVGSPAAHAATTEEMVVAMGGGFLIACAVGLTITCVGLVVLMASQAKLSERIRDTRGWLSGVAKGQNNQRIEMAQHFASIAQVERHDQDISGLSRRLDVLEAGLAEMSADTRAMRRDLHVLIEKLAPEVKRG